MSSEKRNQNNVINFPGSINQKRCGNSPEVGSTNYQPVMFDMDPFGGKKVSCTKYQESDMEVVRTPSWHGKGKVGL
mgnify:CR=1 FL=1